MQQAFIRATIRPITAVLALAAMLLVLHSVSAFAQGADEGGNRPTRRTDEQKQNDADADKAYRAAIRGDKSLPKVKVDPWRSVRSADEEKKPEH